MTMYVHVYTVYTCTYMYDYMYVHVYAVTASISGYDVSD